MARRINKTRIRAIAGNLRVSDFADYQSYLNAVYAQAKQEDESYSFARFSEDLGLASTNAHSVVRGRRPLTRKTGERVCASLHLTGVERRYFLALVDQSRARSTAEREAVFQERLDLKRQVLPTDLSKRQLAFFEKWHHAAILEVLRIESSSDDAAWLASTLRPAISEADARESLELLKDLGYVAFDAARGRNFPTEARITTGNEVWGLAVSSYHRQMIGLALASMDHCPPDQRDLGAVTVAIPREALAQVKDELAAVRKRLLALADQVAPTADSIIQVNLQMFPLALGEGSQRPGKKAS